MGLTCQRFQSCQLGGRRWRLNYTIGTVNCMLQDLYELVLMVWLKQDGSYSLWVFPASCPKKSKRNPITYVYRINEKQRQKRKKTGKIMNVKNPCNCGHTGLSQKCVHKRYEIKVEREKYGTTEPTWQSFEHQPWGKIGTCLTWMHVELLSVWYGFSPAESFELFILVSVEKSWNHGSLTLVLVKPILPNQYLPRT